ncbi:MAG: DotD/TraH family lipoprotein [Candidatus Competibacteraceae bacterium]|nr:DotD/TraH family lipoprotein [Candidatus Competibacteraceae bacterium]
MKNKFGVFILLGLFGLLSACAGTNPPVAADHGAAQRRLLAESGARIADSLAKLAVVEQSAHRIHAQTLTSAEDTPEALRLRVAVDYQGDLKPFVHQLAQVVGYEVKTYGVSSVLTPINVQSDDRSVGELLADAGYQASWRCQVVVDSSRRRVEILYDNRHPARPASRGRG